MSLQLNRFRKRTVSTVAALVLSASAAWAVNPFPLRDIRVEGLQRVEAGTVFASLPLKVGDTYTDEKGAAAIRALFALGLFKDVRLETSGDVLVVIVEERPSVADVQFVGAKEFEKDALLKSLREVGLADGRPYDKALTDRAEQELKRQYINRGFYAAEIVTTATPIERNRVNLTFTVTEGAIAKIKEIRIIGTQAFSESTLRGLFQQDTSGWLSWYTKADRYSRAKLNADLETLRTYYLSRGYLEFRVDSTQVSISPDKQDITIAVNVTEGNRFIVSSVTLEGNLLDREDEFKSLVSIKVGEPYNVEELNETTKRFSDYFANFGFAFARVDVRPEVDRINNRVAFVLHADPSRRAYVRRINISGNDKTRDEVIRRELRQTEASWYDGNRIKLSRDRVDRLGYFTSVGVDTTEVTGAPDQVDLNVQVVEKPTGSFTLGAGFSSSDKLSFNAGIKQENAFGSGNYLGLELNTSKFNTVAVVSTINPYFTEDGISQAVDLYYRNTKPYTDQGGNYRLATAGVGVRYGVPFSERDTVYFGVALEATKIIPGTSIPAAYLAFADEFGYTSTAVPLTIGWSRDDRDSGLIPTKGTYQKLSAELAPFGDSRYMKASYQFQYYTTLFRDYTFFFNTDLGYGKGYGGKPFPVFKNFYAGGLGSVRGFEQNSLGPRDVTGFYVGANKKFTLNGEFYVPVPGTGNDKTLRMFTFADYGNVFGDNERIRPRASVGMGVSWISPLGPLRFVYAYPVIKYAGDKIQNFQFQIGSSF